MSALTSKLCFSDHTPPPRGGGNGGPLFTEKEYFNVLQCMGQSIHVVSPEGLVIYWNRAAENQFGYSEAEAIGKNVYDLMISSRDLGVAEVVVNRSSMGQNWSGQFPVRHKMGHAFTIVAATTTLYDDDGTLIGVVCITCDLRSFKDTKVFVLDSEASEIVPNHDLSLQTSIASKFKDLACKVSSKIRSKMKAGESNVFWGSRSGDGHHFNHASVLANYREDGNPSDTCTPRGDSAGIPFGVFTSFITGKSYMDSQGDIIGESEWKLGINEILASKAAPLNGKNAMQWSDRYATEHQRCRLGWPWKQVSSFPHSEVKPETQISDDISPVPKEAFRSWSLYNSNSPSSSSSCESVCISPLQTLDVETDSLDYEVLWGDLTVGEQIGQGDRSCWFYE